jgi:hypothetical protein
LTGKLLLYDVVMENEAESVNGLAVLRLLCVVCIRLMAHEIGGKCRTPALMERSEVELMQNTNWALVGFGVQLSCNYHQATTE